MDDTHSFGQWLKQRRRDLDFTQEALAEVVNCSVATIRKLECDRRRPSKQIAELLAIHLQVAPDERDGIVRWARQPTCGQLPSLSPPPLQRNRVPIPLTPLIGRSETLAALCQTLLSSHVRLLTLVGAPGIGKTRLALQIAAELQAHYADGVHFVNLAPIHEPSLVLPTIASALHVDKAGERDGFLDALKEALSNRELLLVLDNFEQLRPAAMYLPELLMAAPGLTVLVTSREALHLYGEHCFPIPPLAVPDLAQIPCCAQWSCYPAIQLFVQRAQATRPDFYLTEENAEAVAKLCTALDGLPLAIELAAARIRLLSPGQMVARMENRLDWLSDGSHDRSVRHQTLRATLDWSYNLLDGAEQTLLRRIAVFANGCTVEDVQDIYSGDGERMLDILDGLASLLDKNLLRLQEGVSDEPHFTMPEMVRAYALEKLAESREDWEMRERWARYRPNYFSTAR